GGGPWTGRQRPISPDLSLISSRFQDFHAWSWCVRGSSTTKGARQKMWKIAIALFLGVLVLAPEANAQYARQELLAFESATMSLGDFLTGKNGTPVTLAGDLRLPK